MEDDPREYAWAFETVERDRIELRVERNSGVRSRATMMEARCYTMAVKVGEVGGGSVDDDVMYMS